MSDRHDSAGNVQLHSVDRLSSLQPQGAASPTLQARESTHRDADRPRRPSLAERVCRFESVASPLTGLAAFRHLFHTLLGGFLVFKFCYESSPDIAEAVIHLDDLRGYGLSVAVIIAASSLLHLGQHVVFVSAHALRCFLKLSPPDRLGRRKSLSGSAPDGLTLFLHSFHLLAISFLLFKFFYLSRSGLAEAVLSLDEIQKYGLAVGLIVAVFSSTHLIRHAMSIVRSSFA